MLTAAALIGEELGLPVVLYGQLATRPEHERRADLRQGGWQGIAARIEAGDVVPDYGPKRAHPSAGVLLAAARPPLLAFNVDLDTDDVELAKQVAGELREGGARNRDAVRGGLRGTGRIIVTAAAIMVVAFGGFATGSDIGLKEFGFGLAAAIAIDALLIRCLIVPAVLAMAGERTWRRRREAVPA